MASSCVPASRVRVAATAARARRPRGADAPQAGARPRRDDELPRGHRRKPRPSSTKLALEGAEHVDGHAPGVLGNALQAYAAAGIRSDHEMLTVEEGRERLRAGVWLLIREASMARNLRALLPLVEEYGPGRIAFCTDDRDPEDIADNGHVNGMVRDAVAAGVDPADAIVMASFHPAQWHRLAQHGAVAPGYVADLLLLPDLETFVPELVLKRGRPDRGRAARPRCPSGCARRVRLEPVAAGRLRDPVGGGAAARAIGLVEDQVVTESLEREPLVVDGQCRVRPRSATSSRSRSSSGTSRPGGSGSAFVSGSGLQRGALASTVAHDAHNLVVVGASDEDMAFAVQPARRGRRRHRRRRRRPRRRRVPAAGRRPALRPAARRRRRAEPRLQRRGARARLDGRDALPDARLPRAVGDPVAQAHRPRARRRRPLRDRPAARRRGLALVSQPRRGRLLRWPRRRWMRTGCPVARGRRARRCRRSVPFDGRRLRHGSQAELAGRVPPPGGGRTSRPSGVLAGRDRTDADPDARRATCRPGRHDADPTPREPVGGGGGGPPQGGPPLTG